MIFLSSLDIFSFEYIVCLDTFRTTGEKIDITKLKKYHSSLTIKKWSHPPKSGRQAGGQNIELSVKQ
jgi:hypothetical protein